MNIRHRLFDAWFVLLLVVSVAGVAHIYVAKPLTLKRAVYPLEAVLALTNIRCSRRAPTWMLTLIKEVVWHHASLANQLAYVDPTGGVHHCESGWTSTPFRSPLVAPETRFRFASLTKLITADAVLAQINEGRITLGTRLPELIPDLPPLSDPRLTNVTVEQLLRHQAGFDRLRRPDPMTMHGKQPWCPDRLSAMSDIKLDFDPGTRFAYANISYCLLGVALERITRVTYRNLMELEYGLAKRGLRFIDGPYRADEVSYDFRNSDFYGEDYYRHFDFSALSSSAGLSGNAVSLASLVWEITKRKPLSLLSFNADKSDCNTRVYRGCYGFAVGIYDGMSPDLRLYVQSGYLYGTASQAVVDSQGGVTVWLGNGAAVNIDASSTTFLSELQILLKEFYAHSGKT